MIEIDLGNIGDKEQVLKIKAKIEGKTYMNFQVHYSSYMGNYPVTVTTEYDTTKEDAIKMLLFVMACEM